MTKNERMAAIAKNLLQNKNCQNCNNQSQCNFKSKIEYNTCLKWVELLEFQFSMNSYNMKISPKKLKINWLELVETKLSNAAGISVEDELSKLAANEINNQLEIKFKEDTDYGVIKELSKWVPKK